MSEASEQGPDQSRDQGSNASLMRVLLIDDEPGDYEFIRRVLAKATWSRYELGWTHSYEHALQLMERNAYAAYMVACRLGACTGIDLMREARRRACHGPIIIITGYGNHATDLNAMQAGADDYLVKAQIEPYYLDKTIRYAIERNRAERLVVSQQLRLSQVLRTSALGELAASIAHEISNPLAILAGRVAQMRHLLNARDLDRERLLALLAKLSGTTDRMTKIVRTLRSLCRNEPGNPGQYCSVRQITHDAIGLCHGKLQHAGIRLEVGELSPSLTVYACPSEILQVLINLLCNAIDAVAECAECEERWVRVTAHAVSSDFVELVVEDSGPGIPRQMRERILQPYYTTKRDGCGLGLNIVTLILERQNGYLCLVEEAPHTTFVVGLPVAPPAGTLAQRRARVLLVDDDVEAVADLTDALVRRGYEVMKAHDGVHALDVMLKSHVDILLTEVQVPGLDGLALYRRVRAACGASAPQVIFMTGHEGRLHDAISEEIQVVAKPLDLAQVLSVLASVSQG